MALAEQGGLLHAPDVYMDKIATGPGYPDDVIDLDASPGDNLRSLAEAKGVRIENITACILDRPRHADLIENVRLAGADVLFSATGVTDGNLLSGVHFGRNSATTHTVVMRSSSQTVRWIRATHNFLEKFDQAY